MPYPLQSIAHDRGIWPGNIEDIPMFVRNAAAVVGDVLMSDYHATDGEVSTAGASSLGLTTSVWMNMLAPTAAGIDATTGAGAAFGVCQAGVAENGVTTFKFYGFVTCFVLDTAGCILIGDDLVPTTGKALDNSPASGERVIAVSQADVAAATARALQEVFFNGIGHLGQGIA